jgi:hypothetical protein
MGEENIMRFESSFVRSLFSACCSYSLMASLVRKAVTIIPYRTNLWMNPSLSAAVFLARRRCDVDLFPWYSSI